MRNATTPICVPRSRGRCRCRCRCVLSGGIDLIRKIVPLRFSAAPHHPNFNSNSNSDSDSAPCLESCPVHHRRHRGSSESDRNCHSLHCPQQLVVYTSACCSSERCAEGVWIALRGFTVSEAKQRPKRRAKRGRCDNSRPDQSQQLHELNLPHNVRDS